MPLNFGPPVIDFSPLGKLGETYDKARKSQAEYDLNENRQKALASFGQGGDLAALGKTLMQAGDLEGAATAFRLQAAQEGTPYQRGRDAVTDADRAAARREAAEERDRAEEHRRRTEERFDRPERVTGSDKYDNPREGVRDPRTGTIRWNDGTVEEGTPGPRSGGADDPNLPAPNAGTAQLALSPQTSTDPGYVIPKTRQGFPVGTELPPGGLAALAPPAPQGGAAVAAQPAPLAPPAATGGAAVAQSPVAAAAQTAGQPPPPGTAGGAVPGAPITATQISQGTANIPSMTLEEMFQESQRLGISMKQYRAARAAEIQKELTSKAGGGVDAEKALPGEAAGRLGIAEQYLADAPKIREEIAAGNQTGPIDKFVANAGWGRRGQVQRQIASGVDALRRMLTGAGMPASEAADYVKRYEPEFKDQSADLLTKHDQLVAEISHWRDLAYRGKGAPGELPKPVREYGADSKPLDIGGTRDLGGGITLKRLK